MLSHPQVLVAESAWSGEALRAAEIPVPRWDDVLEDAGLITWEADATSMACRAIDGPLQPVLGFPAAHFTDHPLFWLSRLVDGDEALLRAVVQQAVTTGERQTFTIGMRAASERIVWLRATARALPPVDGQPRLVRGTFCDLDVAAAAPGRVVCHAPADRLVQLWVADATGQRRVIAPVVEPGADRILTASGVDWLDGIHHEDRDRYAASVSAASRQRVAFELRYHRRLADGGYRLIYERGDPCFAADGTLTGYTGYTIDIDALRRIVLGEAAGAEEHDVIAEAEALRRSDRLKSEFIANVSHELRTPLHHIKGYASTLLRPQLQLDSDTVRDYLRIIVEETDHLERLVADLLDTSHIERQTLSLDIDSVRIDDLARKVVRHWALNGTHNFELILPADVPPVPADALRIEQVLNNLLSNVVRYTPAHTLTTIRLDVRRTEIEVSVRDRGPGVPTAHLSRLFERFYRVESDIRRVERGSGLGLFICKGIVEQHNGRIWAAAAPDGGLIISFTLPRRRASARA